MQFCGLIAAHWALQFFRVQVHTSGQPVLKTRKSRTFSAKFFAMRHSSDFQNLETFWIGPICQGKVRPQQVMLILGQYFRTIAVVGPLNS